MLSDRPELVKIANRKLRGLCGHQRFTPVQQTTGCMNITVEGRSAEKAELDTPDWITVLNKCNLEEKWAWKSKVATEEMKVIDAPPPTAKRNGREQAEKSIASNQVKLPENGWRIIFRLKGGMLVKQYDGLTRPVPNEVTVHLAVPDDFSRGFIHRTGLKTSLQKIKQEIAEHEENPKVLEIRRLGQSNTIMLTFTTKEQQEQWKLYQEQTQAQIQDLRNHVIELQMENTELKAQLKQPEAHLEVMDDKACKYRPEVPALPKKKRVKKTDSGLEKAEGKAVKL
ncbi:hypothetical protein V5799_017137 [Amblyomma americanum]|uniref:Uncharacterized protein n=1 Tax=Amblyomma americanum TaxID=6943 RepID=A0AAQ4F462_AMBAM